MVGKELRQTDRHKQLLNHASRIHTQADISKVVCTGCVNLCTFTTHVYELLGFICHHFVFQHPQTGKLHELPSVVSKQQPLEIYDPVKVEPTPLVLLWDPVSEFKYTHTLKVRVP